MRTSEVWAIEAPLISDPLNDSFVCEHYTFYQNIRTFYGNMCKLYDHSADAVSCSFGFSGDNLMAL